MTDDAGDTKRGDGRTSSSTEREPTVDATDASAPPTVADSATSPALLGPGIGAQFGRFRIEALLGSGGMGSVYHAYDTLLDREVALKVLHPTTRPTPAENAEDTSARRRRIIREARAAAGLSHPNTVTIYEVGDVEGVPFIAMELLRGKSLRTLMREGGAIPFSKKIDWLLCAARALEAAHMRGLVHRDVKPDNMFVCEDGSLKLLDFGIAKTGDDESVDGISGGPSSLRTELGRRVGTPKYMAPEQRDGSGTDARTDQYSWGLVAFELLTGCDPRAADTSEDVGASAGHAMAAGYEAVLRERAPELAPPIARGIARALSPARDERFTSMSSLVTLLDEPAPEAAAADGHAIAQTSPPASPAADAPPGNRRSPRLVALVALGLVAAALVGTAAVARRRGIGPLAASRAPTPPVCRIESTRTVAGETPDLVGLLRGDPATVVSWYKPIRLLSLETGFMREGDAGELEPFKPYPIGFRDRQVVFQGTSFKGKPAFVSYQSTLEWGVFSAWSLLADTHTIVRFDFVGSGLAAAETPDGLVTVLAGFKPRKPHTSVVWTHKWLHEHSRSDRKLVYEIEGANITDPAVAVDGGRTAVAFAVEDDIVVLFVAGDGVRMGDPIKVVSGGASQPAIAFAGDKLVVVWIDKAGANARLRATTLEPSSRAPAASVAVSDDALAPVRPLLVARPGADPLLVWGSHVFGEAVLRIAPVGSDLRARAPLDVARGSTLRSVDAAASASGATVAFIDGAATRVTRVACATAP